MFIALTPRRPVAIYSWFHFVESLNPTILTQPFEDSFDEQFFNVTSTISENSDVTIISTKTGALLL